MRTILKAIIITSLLISSLYATNGKSLAIEHNLIASSKASSQWNRIFKKTRKMKKLGIDKLTEPQKEALLEYLVNHAADSDSPEAAGM
jgi:hypothetical protein